MYTYSVIGPLLHIGMHEGASNSEPAHHAASCWGGGASLQSCRVHAARASDGPGSIDTFPRPGWNHDTRPLLPDPLLLMSRAHAPKSVGHILTYMALLTMLMSLQLAPSHISYTSSIPGYIV